MLIKTFCEVTGLPRDTVRFYVKRGLLTPLVGSGPGNRYQVFDKVQVDRARLIKAAQKLGFSLRQIEQFAADYEKSALGCDEKVSLLRSRLADLDDQARTLRELRDVLSGKLLELEAESAASGARNGPDCSDAGYDRITRAARPPGQKARKAASKAKGYDAGGNASEQPLTRSTGGAKDR